MLAASDDALYSSSLCKKLPVGKAGEVPCDEVARPVPAVATVCGRTATVPRSEPRLGRLPEVGGRAPGTGATRIHPPSKGPEGMPSLGLRSRLPI